MARSLRVAIEGCGHGTLDAIYASVAKSSSVKGWDGVDLLIIGGDFQAVRNATDLTCMAVPMKYREIGDFHKYYSGERVAPYLTLFIGGNHEASNHLWELYYGGWVAPNIYYLGAANVVRLGGLRIAGLSGIWKGYNFNKPHHERLPYNQDDVRSIYHVRELDTRKLLQIRTQVDVGISHDWPKGIEWKGNWKRLFQRKNGFEADARDGSLGSVAAKLVFDHLKPAHWFSAHLHTKFAAIVDHAKGTQISTSPSHPVPSESIKVSNGSLKVQNDEEIDLDMDDNEPPPPTSSGEINTTETETISAETSKDPKTDGSTETTEEEITADLRAQLPASFAKPGAASNTKEPDPPTTIENPTTKFLALDKCLPKRDFLQLLEIEPTCSDPTTVQDAAKPRLAYDPEWLAVTRAFALAEPLQLGDAGAHLVRNRGRAHYAPLIAKQETWVDENITQQGKLFVPENFATTAPVYDASQAIDTQEMPREYNNAQTEAFCQLLGIENQFAATDEEIGSRMTQGPRPSERRSGGSDRGRGGRGFGGRGRGRGRGGGGRGWRG